MTTPRDPTPARAEERSQQRWASSSSLVEAMTDEDYGVTDLMALTGASTPAWIHGLPVPRHWYPLELPEAKVAVPPARVLVRGPRTAGGWEATDTLSVYGFTGCPAFSIVLDSTARSLHELAAQDIATRMLAIPSGPGLAAERSTATLAVEGRRIWVQLTNYLAGSDHTHAGRLIVHSVYIDAERLSELADDVRGLTHTIQDRFLALVTPHEGNG
jgi:hypothetical protein